MHTYIGISIIAHQGRQRDSPKRERAHTWIGIRINAHQGQRDSLKRERGHTCIGISVNAHQGRQRDSSKRERVHTCIGISINARQARQRDSPKLERAHTWIGISINVHQGQRDSLKRESAHTCIGISINAHQGQRDSPKRERVHTYIGRYQGRQRHSQKRERVHTFTGISINADQGRQRDRPSLGRGGIVGAVRGKSRSVSADRSRPAESQDQSTSRSPTAHFRWGRALPRSPVGQYGAGGDVYRQYRGRSWFPSRRSRSPLRRRQSRLQERVCPDRRSRSPRRQDVKVGSINQTFIAETKNLSYPGINAPSKPVTTPGGRVPSIDELVSMHVPIENAMMSLTSATHQSSEVPGVKVKG